MYTRGSLPVVTGLCYYFNVDLPYGLAKHYNFTNTVPLGRKKHCKKDLSGHKTQYTETILSLTWTDPGLEKSTDIPSGLIGQVQ